MRQDIFKIIVVLALNITATLCNFGGSHSTGEAPFFIAISPATASAKTIVVGANDLGMHCMDREFSIFCMLPPFNVVNAQVIMQDDSGRPFLAETPW